MLVGHSARLDHVPVLVELARAGPPEKVERRRVMPAVVPALLDDPDIAARYSQDLDAELQAVDAGAD
eukprot:2348729-Lingulodinium_polyedra.AAC.1